PLSPPPLLLGGAPTARADQRNALTLITCLLPFSLGVGLHMRSSRAFPTEFSGGLHASRAQRLHDASRSADVDHGIELLPVQPLQLLRALRAGVLKSGEGVGDAGALDELEFPLMLQLAQLVEIRIANHPLVTKAHR